ncbi:MAG: peptidylprolyl isomerase [Spirochaetia bacterium]|jgi:FKBP-type peptidyl-prolyl cis-trans isomerase SlyD
MIVSKNRVVSIAYTLTGEDGTILDRSRGEEPLSYLHGTGSMIEGLETALEGKAPPDHVSVSIAPEQAYGARDDSIVFSVPRAQFREVDDLQIGMQFPVQGDGEGHMVTLIGMDADEVTVDGNHPLAGLTLHFDVDIVDVREATPDELEHGHPHEGPSAHSH